VQLQYGQDCQQQRSHVLLCNLPKLVLATLQHLRFAGSGNGLWTCRPFHKNDLITEYCGPLIDYEKACKLRKQGKHTHVRVLNSQWLYINGLQEPLPGVGGASFANDARDPDVNNSAFIQKYVVPPEYVTAGNTGNTVHITL